MTDGRRIGAPLETLKILSEAIGVSGFEEEPRSKVQEMIAPLVDTLWVDPLGNLLAIKKGLGADTKRILLDAHLDEIGFLIKHIDEQGFLYFDLLGGWDSRILPGQTVVIQPLNLEQPVIKGVIGIPPPHITSPEERMKTLAVRTLCIDIGAETRQEVLDRGLDIGCPGTIFQAFSQLTPNRVLGKAFDDRGGCSAIIHVLGKLIENPVNSTVVCSFSVAEEVGSRGARVGAYTLNPSAALAVETTTAADVPGVAQQDCPTILGNGPAITIADNSLIADKRIVNTLKEAANNQNIAWQYKKPLIGGTNAGQIHMVREGIPTGVISIPCRYIHSPVNILNPVDFEATISVIEEFVRTWQ